MLHYLTKAIRRLLLLGVATLILALVLALTPFPWRLLYPLRYQDLITQEAQKLEVDPSLVAAIINVESRWQENAVSPKGARGLMQLMPTTAAWIADKMGLEYVSEQELFIPEKNIRLGVSYLADLLENFEQNTTIALAAYNGGRGNVSSWLNEGVWDGSKDTVEAIPFGETRRYVLKVEAQQQIYSRIYRWP
ncbi:MAG: lytic transglycosylase domain-containing protein [Firmicutes bacterium]|nr:lytic transglycosylase domain-containing protein [Bacillota bacterium]